jgi:hypothetical protein
MTGARGALLPVRAELVEARKLDTPFDRLRANGKEVR